MKKIKTIVLCSSGSFYKNLFPIEESLKKLGYKVVVPETASKMKKKNDFNIDPYKTWYKDPKDYYKKRAFIDKHFKKIIKGDAILVVNHSKKGIKGYIGGNVLMEITIAYFYKKPIFILNDIEDNSLIKEEIYGVNPVFLKGSLSYFTSLR